MVFRSAYLSIAWYERSRPKPGLFEAAEGGRQGRAIERVHPHTVPARRAPERRWETFMSEVQTAAARP